MTKKRGKEEWKWLVVGIALMIVFGVGIVVGMFSPYRIMLSPPEPELGPELVPGGPGPGKIISKFYRALYHGQYKEAEKRLTSELLTEIKAMGGLKKLRERDA